MKRTFKFAMGVVLGITLVAVGLGAQSSGLQNLKLRSVGSAVVLANQAKNAVSTPGPKDAIAASNTRVNPADILSGGVAKDAIPSLDAPEFDTAQTTSFEGEAIVIGLEINGEAKAYPFRIMDWHEMVNDTVGGINVAVSYCPLCDTIVAFERGETTFGVSGKLYQSCLVMYDRADDTLYSQPWGLGIAGEKVNADVRRIPAVKTTLAHWLAQHPNSKILSTRTGHTRNYAEYPYGTYYTDDNIIFPVRNQAARTLHPKTIVSYVWENNGETPQDTFAGASAQFVHTEVKAAGRQVKAFADRQIQARWDDALETVIVEEMDGTLIPSSTAFAFVYPAFYGQ